ncbi:histidine kinase [Flavobacterium sp. 3HN19-14]|uniref:histidine kinase n=1 Tax=Flavobacterium sp. 3HN19-14 TaxID=3448133 RepID=UPI003EE317E6
MKVIQENDIIAVIIYTSLAFVLMTVLLIMFYYFSKKKIVQHELEKKDLIINHQREMLHSVILTQEEERKRIAQDLHDDISSKLNIVSLNSHLLTTPNLSEKELSEITLNIINLTAKALENSRRIAHDLLPRCLKNLVYRRLLKNCASNSRRPKGSISILQMTLFLIISKKICTCRFSGFCKS